jgi:hypothetical protein
MIKHWGLVWLILTLLSTWTLEVNWRLAAILVAVAQLAFHFTQAHLQVAHVKQLWATLRWVFWSLSTETIPAVQARDHKGAKPVTGSQPASVRFAASNSRTPSVARRTASTTNRNAWPDVTMSTSASTNNNNRIPFDKLPTFKEGKQEPLDFLENLLRHLKAYQISESRYVSVFPMCLDADANRWLDRWQEQQVREGIDVTWGLLREAFETRFKHYHLSSVLTDKWRALRMEVNGAGKFVDAFMQLTTQLGLDVADEQVISSIQDWVN